MKTLTIRLDDDTYEKLEELKAQASTTTLNATINYAIKIGSQYATILEEFRTLFTKRIEVDQEKFKKLNEKYGLLQGNLF